MAGGVGRTKYTALETAAGRIAAEKTAKDNGEKIEKLEATITNMNATKALEIKNAQLEAETTMHQKSLELYERALDKAARLSSRALPR